MTKQCRVCGQRKALNKFYGEPRNKDRKSGTCSECVLERQRARFVPAVKQCVVCGKKFHPWGKQITCSPEHSQIRQAQTVARWNAKPENKKKKAASSRKHYWSNPEKCREYHRIWSAEERRDPIRGQRRRMISNLWVAARKDAINERRRRLNKQKRKILKYAKEILKQTGVEL